MTVFPKRRFGQHFLRDTGVIRRIVHAIQPASEDLIVEIGAGEAALSVMVAPHVSGLLAIEVDRDRIPVLEQKLAPFQGAAVLSGDILQMELPPLLAPYMSKGERLRIIGNLPYNIATAIIQRVLSAALPIHDMVFMVQLEVAERIVALPGSRQYGYLSVRCQRLCETKIHFKISPECFTPRPKVNSALISLLPKRQMRGAPFEDCFSWMVKAAFSHRRKTLSNSLRQEPHLGSIVDQLLSLAGIDGCRRAEELTVREYESLTSQFLRYKQEIRSSGGTGGPSDHL